jgi:acetyl-CoA acyltransferase
MVPMMGHKIAMNPAVFKDENIAIAYGMGITAENVAERVEGLAARTRMQFALRLAPEGAGRHRGWRVQGRDPAPFTLDDHYPDLANRSIINDQPVIDTDEGPRADTTAAGLAKLRTVFKHRRQRHRRQFLADERWRRRGAAGQRKGDQGIRPDAAGALFRLLGRRRAP